MRSVVGDQALAAGGLVVGAELLRLRGARERADIGAIDHALRAEVSAPDDGAPIAQFVRELGLERAERRLRLALGLLRGELHEIAAGGNGADRLARRNPRPWRAVGALVLRA